MRLQGVAGGHLFSASPVLRSALVVQAGQNVSLACNLTSRQEITWYLLRSDQLLPVLTVRSSRVGEDTVNVHIADRRRVNSVGDLKSGSVGLEIEEVQEDDAGLYFCTGRCAGAVCVNRGIHLVLDGVDVTSARQPCWTLGIAVLVALLVLCVVASVGVCVCSGKPDVCCCKTASSSTSLKVTESESLHYSSLQLADKLRPQRGAGLVEERVTYSSVAIRMSPNRSHDCR
ncbi:uncharacterized protein LOC109140321 isoform X2 [Larimichthys crocea]|uniref:uncharacterized protein LOC109140321 isoform X2 n=1 Tax=Larimichthys crocea TaxID=215358 RepID=UPI000F5F63BE|nr:uncharacterized protein LOC109140321 isoform X2 [Larimichthys crocea]